MERNASGAKSRKLFTRFMAATALVVMYLVSTLVVSGLALTTGSTPAAAKKKGGGGGGGGGSRRRRSRGRGGVFVFGTGVAYCTYWRDECASTYGWGSRGYYRCLRRHGC
jgi:hypothetical protein